MIRRKNVAGTAQTVVMLYVSYAGSMLVGQAGAIAGRSGTRVALSSVSSTSAGLGHHLIVFGEAISPGMPLRARWGGVVSVIDGAGDGFDAIAACVPEGGAILVRPDGFIGFRAAPVDEATLAALDAHLASYLIADAAGTPALAAAAD